MIHSRVQGFTGEFPSTVQITTSKTASVVPVNNAVRVKHRYDLEDKFVSKIVGGGIVTDEEVDQPLNFPRGVRLSRVNPPRDDDSLLLLFLFKASSVGDGQILALVSGKGSTESVSAYILKFSLFDVKEIAAKF